MTEPLDVVVLTGFHVNSDQPKDEFLIPLKLTWAGGPLEIQGVSYPKPEEMKVGSQSYGFYRQLSDRNVVQAPANAPVGNVIMVGKLRYQACNNEMCFRPASVDVHLPVSVE